MMPMSLLGDDHTEGTGDPPYEGSEHTFRSQSNYEGTYGTQYSEQVSARTANGGVPDPHEHRYHPAGRTGEHYEGDNADYELNASQANSVADDAKFREMSPEQIEAQLRGMVNVGPDRSESKAALEFLKAKIDTHIAIERLAYMPLRSGCTMATIQLGIPHGPTIHLLRKHAAVSCVQTEDSLSLFPEFSECYMSAPLMPKIVAIVSIDVVERTTGFHGTLGHAIIPLYNKAGRFDVKLRAGPPVLEGQYRTTKELPLATLRYRVNQPEPEFAPDDDTGVIRMFFRNDDEKDMIAARKRDGSVPGDFQLGPNEAAVAFADTDCFLPTLSDGSLVDLGLAPYSVDDGICCAMHGLRGILPIESETSQNQWNVLYKVGIEIGGKMIGHNKMHDWSCDVRAPKFLDEVIVIEDVELSEFTVGFVKLFALQVQPSDGSWVIETKAFAPFQIFHEDEDFLRFSPRMELPFYEGSPSFEMIIELKSAALGEVMGDMQKEGTLTPFMGGVKMVMTLAGGLRLQTLRKASTEQQLAVRGLWGLGNTFNTVAKQAGGRGVTPKAAGSAHAAARIASGASTGLFPGMEGTMSVPPEMQLGAAVFGGQDPEAMNAEANTVMSEMLESMRPESSRSTYAGGW